MIRQPVVTERRRVDAGLGIIVVIAVILSVGGAFAAGALGFLPIRYPLAVLLAIASVGVLLGRPSSRARNAVLVAIPVWTVGVMIFCSVVSPLDPAANDALFRYILLFPGAAVAGWLVATSAYREWIGRALVGFALISSVLAIVEWSLGQHLVDRGEATDALVREGMTRAVVLSEHPLVLSALLAAALPFVWALSIRWWLAAGLSALLVAGILATGSRGGLALVALCVVLIVLGRKWPARAPGRPLVRVLVGVGAAVLLIAVLSVSGFLSIEFLTSDDPATASLQYRVVLYQKVIESLGTHPFGWGIGGLPAGTFLVPSPFGIHDLSVTVDSEVALLAFDAGFLGIAGYAAVTGFLVSRWVLASAFGQAALLLSAAGFYLAIHAWTGLALVAVLVIAAAVADSRLRRLN